MGKVIVKRVSLLLAVLTLLAVFAGCGGKSGGPALTVLSASENQEIVPVLTEFTKKTGIRVNMTYKGSVDIMQALEQKDVPYDAVWPANSMWITMGDTAHKVKLQQSVMTSPVVFGIRKSLARQLGFVGRSVTVKDIMQAVSAGKLKFCMTSSTQSNSGASAYIGFWYAMLNNPDMLTSADLDDKTAQAEMRTLLGGIDRSSGSSEWLKDLYLKGGYDAMVNYEDVIISTDQELVKEGKEPLYIVYPQDGLTIADSPLGYIDNGDAKKEEMFKKLQSYLLTDSVQKELLGYGRRTGAGASAAGGNPSVFNPDWGVDTTRTLNSLKMPSSETLLKALNLYQTELRKPSYTVYCLDFSGSMADNGGEKGVKEAMKLLLDQKQSSMYFLQPTAGDQTVVIPFSDRVKDVWQVQGSDAGQLQALDDKINALQAGGGTDIYTPVMRGLSILGGVDPQKYNIAVILMTDGQSNTGASFDDAKTAWEGLHKDIPVFSIGFGDASTDQLLALSDLTKAKLFDGHSDLLAAFKSAKGYN